MKMRTPGAWRALLAPRRARRRPERSIDHRRDGRPSLDPGPPPEAALADRHTGPFGNPFDEGDVESARWRKSSARTARIAIARPRAALWTPPRRMTAACAVRRRRPAGLVAEELVDGLTEDARGAGCASMEFVCYLGETVDDAPRQAARRAARKAGCRALDSRRASSRPRRSARRPPDLLARRRHRPSCSTASTSPRVPPAWVSIDRLPAAFRACDDVVGREPDRPDHVACCAEHRRRRRRRLLLEEGNRGSRRRRPAVGFAVRAVADGSLRRAVRRPCSCSSCSATVRVRLDQRPSRRVAGRRSCSAPVPADLGGAERARSGRQLRRARSPACAW